MPIQKINLGVPITGIGGDTYRQANTKVNDNFDVVTATTTALDNKDKSQDTIINKSVTDINGITTRIDTLVTTVDNKNTLQDTEVTAIKAKNTVQDTDITNIKAKDVAQDIVINKSVADLVTVNSYISNSANAASKLIGTTTGKIPLVENIEALAKTSELQNSINSLMQNNLDLKGLIYEMKTQKTFEGGKTGAWYVPSDITTLYQDSFGTIPVKTVGDPVGLILDKSQGLELGSELMSNNNFNSDINGWTALNSSAATVTWDNGRLKLNNVSGTSTGGQTARYVVPTVIGKTYKISAKLENTNAARFQVRSGSALIAVWYAETVGTRDIQIVFTATLVNTNLDIDLAHSGAWSQGTIWLDNISVKELKGNHAIQSVSAARPIYNNTPNSVVLDKVDDALIINVPTGGWIGTMVLASANGTASYGINIPAGNYTLGGRLFPATKLVGAVFRHGAMTTEEKESVESYFESKGAVRSFTGVTNFTSFWEGKSELINFPLIDTSNGINMSDTWRNCGNLPSFPLLNTSKVTSMYSSWRDCRNLVSFPLLDTSSVTNMSTAWHGCTKLANFPANMFNNVKTGNFQYTFLGTSLTQTSIDNILTSLVTSGIATSTRIFDQSGGSAPSATGNTAINTLRSRGWTVTVTGGY